MRAWTVLAYFDSWGGVGERVNTTGCCLVMMMMTLSVQDRRTRCVWDPPMDILISTAWMVPVVVGAGVAATVGAGVGAGVRSGPVVAGLGSSAPVESGAPGILIPPAPGLDGPAPPGLAPAVLVVSVVSAVAPATGRSSVKAKL